MPPRRLRIVSSSDDDDDNDVVSREAQPNHYADEAEAEAEGDVIITDGDADADNNNSNSNSIDVDLQSVTLNSSNTPQNPHISRQPLSPIPLDISSDDEDNSNISEQVPSNSNISQQVPPNSNISQQFSPTSNFSEQVPPSSNISHQVPPPNSNIFEQVPAVFDGSVSGILGKLGLNLRREWLESCLRGLNDAVPGFSSLDNTQKAKLCFEQFLNADMNHCSAGVLPENLHSLHLADLKGPFVLQVDEIVNISSPLRGRYQKAAAGIKRCLKLSMTDGVQRVLGMEYRPINALDVFAPAGLKVAICNVNVRRGILMLVPEAFEVLGGLVEELEAARQRLVQEVNKPPRGKRTRTGAIPPLATRATLAAWPRENINDPGHTNNSRTESIVRMHTDEQGTASGAPVSHSRREYIAVPSHQEAESNPFSAAAMDGIASSTPANDRTREDIASTPANYRTREDIATPANDRTRKDIASTPANYRTREDIASTPANDRTREDIAPSTRNDGTETNSSSAAAMDVEEIHMVDGLDLPYILSGDKEIPFTYMASLLAKWAAMKEKVPSVQGKIKCFLTGVKGFRYKQMATYELRVYIDDGSLISEILIDHNVVQKGIGHSPQEVTAALASSDSKLVSEIKEKLKQFQLFLANFEGMMLVKMSEACPSPVATEMNQGCAASDAWSLLGRLKSTSSAREQQYLHVDPINLSP